VEISPAEPLFYGVRIEDFFISYLSQKQRLPIMKIPSLAVGVLVVVIAAVLLADGILGYVDIAAQFITVRGAKLAVGFALLVLAASYLQKTKE
jgi:hypothetical protein